MAVEIIMPKAGMAMEEGKIIRWLKEVGDSIDVGEAIMEIETDKIIMEHEATSDGVLLAKFYDEGDTVPVTTVVGYIGKAGEAVPKQPASPTPSAPSVPTAPSASESEPALPSKNFKGETPATPYAKTLAAHAGIDISTLSGSGQDGIVKAIDVKRATPLAARIAEDLNINLSQVSGSGFGGKVTAFDLHAPAALGTTASDTSAPLTGMRTVIARRMSQSHTEIPSVTQTMKVYVDELKSLRAKINNKRAEKISINDFILKATAKVVANSPLFRTEIDMEKGQLITRARTNIAMAVSLDDGLLAPVIMDADRLTLSEISARAKDLATRARAGQLLPDESLGSVITVSNLGKSGVFTFTPIINQPNASILGVGSIHSELALFDGNVVERKYLMLCLTYDHRIIDGAQAAEFQARIRDILENPLDILLEELNI